MPRSQGVNAVNKTVAKSASINKLTLAIKNVASWGGMAVVALLPSASGDAPSLQACCNGTLIETWKRCKTADSVACIWGVAAVGVLAVMAVVAIAVSAMISYRKRSCNPHVDIEEDVRSIVSTSSFDSVATTRTTVEELNEPIEPTETIDHDPRTRAGPIDLPFKRLSAALVQVHENAQKLREQYATVITVPAPPIELPRQITPKSSPVVERHNPPGVVISVQPTAPTSSIASIARPRPRPCTAFSPNAAIESLSRTDPALAVQFSWLKEQEEQELVLENAN
jgi:hypothetical protein